jgi:8-oxo-dGTP pyrophosphatase MutT (NUDIX family)
MRRSVVGSRVFGEADMRIEERRAARLFVFDTAGRILLFRHRDPDGVDFWATPGGGLEPGESFEQAARRESLEELGVAPDRLAFAGERDMTFPWGDRIIRQQEQYFRAEYASFELVVTAAHAEEGVLEIRWWAREEIARQPSVVRPHDLAERIVTFTRGIR